MKNVAIEFTEAVFIEAMKILSWTKLSKHLAQTVWTADDVSKLVGH